MILMIFLVTLVLMMIYRRIMRVLLRRSLKTIITIPRVRLTNLTAILVAHLILRIKALLARTKWSLVRIVRSLNRRRRLPLKTVMMLIQQRLLLNVIRKGASLILKLRLLSERRSKLLLLVELLLLIAGVSLRH